MPYPNSQPGGLTALLRKHFLSLLRSAKGNDEGLILTGAKKIYILPTRFGVMYGVLVLALLLGSVNYANNLGYLLTFFLASVGILVMYQTWFNLLNLQLNFLPVKPVFAGQKIVIEAIISNRYNRKREAIQLYSKTGNNFVSEDIAAESSSQFSLALDSSTRGLMSINDLVISSQFPLGLFRAWVYINSDIKVLIYPQASSSWQVPDSVVYAISAQGSKGIGSDDFVSHRNYRQTDSPKQVDWKIFAREKGLMTKQFGGDRSEKLWLSFDLLPDIPLEKSLSMLTRAVIDADNQGIEYGLKIPLYQIPLGQGSIHRSECLKALALYGLNEGHE